MPIENPRFLNSPDNGFKKLNSGKTPDQVELGLDYSVTTLDTFKRKREKPNSALTLDFANRVYEVSKNLDDNILVTSLLTYSEDKRNVFLTELKRLRKLNSGVLKNASYRGDGDEVIRRLNRDDELEKRIEYVRLLPLAPIEWQEFVTDKERVRVVENKVLMQALGSTLFEGPKIPPLRSDLESRITIGDLKKIEISSEFIHESKVPMREIFLATAF